MLTSVVILVVWSTAQWSTNLSICGKNDTKVDTVLAWSSVAVWGALINIEWCYQRYSSLTLKHCMFYVIIDCKGFTWNLIASKIDINKRLRSVYWTCIRIQWSSVDSISFGCSNWQCSTLGTYCWFKSPVTIWMILIYLPEVKNLDLFHYMPASTIWKLMAESRTSRNIVAPNCSTNIPWSVRLSWLQNAHSRPPFHGRFWPVK